MEAILINYMNARERYLAVYSDENRKELDHVPSFVQYVTTDFINQHEDALFELWEGELYYNLRLDPPMVLGIDAVFNDMPGVVSCNAVELEDKDGTMYSVGLNAQVGREGSTYYNRGLLNSMENLDRLRSAMKITNHDADIKTTADFYEKADPHIFSVPAIGGIFDTMWMAMTMPVFAYNYRKQTPLYYETIKFYAEIVRTNVEAIINATGKSTRDLEHIG